MDKKNNSHSHTPHPPEPMAASFIDISHSQLFFSSDENLYKLVDHLGNGGDEIEFCQMQKIRLSDLKKWISQSVERKQIYSAALLARDEWMDAAILRQLRFISQFDIRTIFDERGAVLEAAKWGDAAGAVISQFEVVETFDADGELSGYVKKVKLWDKTKAIDKSVALRNEMIERSRDVAQTDLLGAIKEMMVRRGSVGQVAAPVGSGVRGDIVSGGEIVDVKSEVVDEGAGDE